MAGICSAHQGYDPLCSNCNAIPIEVLYNELVQECKDKYKEIDALKTYALQCEEKIKLLESNIDDLYKGIDLSFALD
jgi:hypothetical protein